jgi:ABC-type Zn uptake system ZnuABC Zn-binding protein ZnuA
MKKIINNSRKHKRAVAALLLTASLAFILTPGCGARGQRPGRLQVAVDIVPLADFCSAVGGDLVEVEMLVPPGASPHAYELTTGQMRFLAEADVLVTVGMGLTPWAEEVFGKVDNPDLVTVVAGEAIPQSDLIPTAAYEEEKQAGREAEHEHGIYDPHIWLDPELAVYIVEAVRDGFIQADPENAAAYLGSAGGYVEELAGLDAEISEEVATFTSRKFVSFHSSWTYFAHRYGLEQVGVIEEQPGKEPSAGEIGELVDLIESQGIKVVFAEPQFSPRAAEAIAEESGGKVVVKILDPLGDPEDPEKDTYLKMMRSNLEVMGEALR